MNAIAALAYADWRGAVNEARRVLRSPARLTLWFVYALGVGAFVLARLFTGRRGAGATADVLTKADYLVCTIVAGIVVLLAGGFGAAGIFRSRAEARFIIGSPVAAPLAIAYLQVREVIGQGTRYVVSLIFFAAVFGPRAIGPNAAILDLGIVAGLFAASAALTVPRRLLSGLPSRMCAVAGIPLGVLALVPALRDVVVQQSGVPAGPAHLIALLPVWHPGRVLLEPNVGWLAATAGLGAIAVAVLAAAGRDAYPELYALSLARFERREGLRGRRRTGFDRAAGSRVFARLPLPAPVGVVALVWKSAVAFRRVTHPALIAAVGVLCAAGGFAVARLDSRFPEAFGTLTGGLIYIAVLTFGRGDALAAELSLPLFWLSPAPMFERLAALAAARVWRAVIACELGAAGIAAGGGTLLHVATFAIGVPALVTLGAGINFAAFACFPSVSDRGGPVVFLRFLVALALLVPPIVVFGVFDGFDMPGAALGATTLLALVEGGLLVGFAAGRLDGRVDLLRG